IAALADQQSVRGAVEVLSGRNHATQATSNNLIAALADPQSVRGAVEVLSGPAYANRDTVNFLVSSTSSRNERRAGACIDILENIAARPDIRPFLEEILRKNQSYAVFTGGQRAFGLSDTARKEIRRLLRPGA
ncbi:hypothetical protein HY095_01365, partial [Candidatus Micrarchaeota archaeon]|nr:hypothetical protein [Candidatus Micrarchaeota archaeon]